MNNTQAASAPNIPATPADEAGRALHRELLAFVLDDRLESLRLAYKTSKFKRKQTHDLAEAFGLEHVSGGASEKDAHVIVWKKGTQRPNRFPKARPPSLTIPITPSPTSNSGSPSPSVPRRTAQPTAAEIQKILEAFVADAGCQYLNFPLGYDTESRRLVHELAGHLQLDHDSFGEKGVDRYVRVTKIDPEVLRQRQMRQNGLNVAYQSYLERVKEARLRTNVPVLRHVVPQCVSPVKLSGSTNFRVVQWNIEWMTYFFDEDPSVTRFVPHNKTAEISDTDELCRNIAKCIREMDPDILFLEEGPSTKAQMDLFNSTYLNDEFIVIGGLENVTQQLYLLCRRNGPISQPTLHAKSLEFLTKSFFYDVDGDRSLIDYKFTRRPLVVEAKNSAGESIFFVVSHLKSKFVARGRDLWLSDNVEDVEMFVNKSIANRRRIQAECFRMRQCVNEVLLKENPLARVVVGGDLNEGPGSGFFEEFYGLINLLDALLGSHFYRTEILHPVLSVSDEVAFSAEFDDYVDNVHPARVLLDHIFVSSSLRGRCSSVVAHDVYQRALRGGGRVRQDRPSDHRPLIADFV